MQNTSSLPCYIGTSGAAKILGKSVKTIHRYIEAGHLTPIGRLENGGPNDALILLRSDVEKLAQNRLTGITA